MPRRSHSNAQISNLSFFMVERACQPFKNISLRLKKAYFCGVCVFMSQQKNRN